MGPSKAGGEAGGKDQGRPRPATLVIGECAAIQGDAPMRNYDTYA